MSDSLDATRILDGLDSTSRACVSVLSVVAETTSTQLDALAAPAPESGCAIYLTERQSAGQGRQGREWISPAGASIAMSVARRFRCDAAALSGLSLVAGIALAEALNLLPASAAGPSAAIGLKWPNDLVADGRKLGGILINLRASNAGLFDAVIGIGININLPREASPQIDQPWCDLGQIGKTVSSRNALVSALLAALLPALEAFERDGMAPFQLRWQRLDALAGQRVRILDGARVHEGIFAGITDSGALRLRDDGHERIFHGGEVSLRPA